MRGGCRDVKRQTERGAADGCHGRLRSHRCLLQERSRNPTNTLKEAIAATGGGVDNFSQWKH